MYDLDSGKVIRTFLRDISTKSRAIPVLFIHGGHAIACGSTEGTVNIWYVGSGLELEPLDIPSMFLLSNSHVRLSLTPTTEGEKVLALAVSF